MASATSVQPSELRLDPITNTATLVAKGRNGRPIGPSICPGCHEEQTPPAVCVFPPGAPLNTPGWKARVVPNLYPCFSQAGTNQQFQLPSGLNGIKDPAGNCEVLFETEHHSYPIYLRSTEEVAFSLRAIVARHQAARSGSSAKFFYAFKNQGRAAGGSLEHEHWQLYTFSFIPPAIQQQYDRAVQYFNNTGRSLYRVMFAAEAAAAARVVACSTHFFTFVPFAAGMPFELRIVPHRNSADFSSMSEDELIDLSQALRDAVARLCAVHPGLAFNVELHSAAFEHLDCPWFCWHLAILPRTTTQAGVELGLNIMVNPVPPEEAASVLRAASVG